MVGNVRKFGKFMGLETSSRLGPTSQQWTSDRRAGREAALKDLNVIAEAVGVDLLPHKLSNADNETCWKNLCEKTPEERPEELTIAQDKYGAHKLFPARHHTRHATHERQAALTLATKHTPPVS